MEGFSTKRAILSVLLVHHIAALSHAATLLPAGFREVVVASALSNPTAMQFSPDGRIFVAEQAGRLRVIKNGTLLPTPFVTLTVSSAGERGLLGIAFDPDFAANQFVYVYYTATTPAVHNRISRFTASGDVALPGSEHVIFELDPLSGATNHNGGAIAFGPDGKLYAAVGENANGANAQSLSNVLGKMLRINRDGSIPSDNPFYATASGNNRAIWALGLRNPFTFAFDPAGSALFINDVGENTWEEINSGVAGANYGWPLNEGATSDPAFRTPIYSYSHDNGCAITGGAFYAPTTFAFPPAYARDYFFADFCGGWIRTLDPAGGNTVEPFASGISFPVDLKVSADGSVYYLARGSGANAGSVVRIEYTSAAPSASAVFSRTDSITQGTWRSTYGADGTTLAAETSMLPAYAQVAVTAQDAWTWSSSTSSVRALQRPVGSQRFAAAWYDSQALTIDLHLTDGAPHQVALYAVDFDDAGRSERVDVIDAGTNTVLDTRLLTQFGGGQYAVWTISGHVIFRVTRTAGANAVISGLFIGGGTTGGSGSAVFSGVDTTTRGTWRDAYGSEGATLAAEGSTLPAFAVVSLSGQAEWTWTAATADVRALQRPAGSSRFAATWYSADGFDLDVHLTDGLPHDVALYAVDFDGAGRTERIDVIDAGAGTVLDTRVLTQFGGGQYSVWTVTGHVIFRVTRMSGPNAVVSGLFIGGGSGAVNTSAVFSGVDTSTQGTWRGTYGAAGAALATAPATLPPYAHVAMAAQGAWTWASSTSDARALQRPVGSDRDRFAATWYGQQVDVDVNLTDGLAHAVALYVVDYDGDGRSARIDVIDAGTNAVLDSRMILEFGGGQYLAWNVTGHVVFRITRTAGANAVLSGLFID